MNFFINLLATLCFISISWQTHNEINPLHPPDETDRETESNQNPVQTTNRDKKRAPYALPDKLRGMPHCARDYEVPSYLVSQIHSFFIQNVRLCMEYCILVSDCRVFSYNFVEKRCSLFDKDDGGSGTVDKKGDIQNFVTFSMLCLECPSRVKHYLEMNLPKLGYKKASGIRIADIISRPKCLSINAPSYDIQWGSCSNSTKWILSWMHYALFAGERNVIRILELSNPERAMDFHKGKLDTGTTLPLSFDPVFTRDFPDSIIEHQIFIISKNKGNCSFCIKKLVFNYTEWGPYTDFTPVAKSIFVDHLTDIQIRLPHNRKTTCFPDHLEVDHSKVENPAQLPFFLKDSKVRIRCDPGYGVAALNYTPFQEVKCLENTLVWPCTSLKFINMTAITDVTVFGGEIAVSSSETDNTSDKADHVTFESDKLTAGHVTKGKAGKTSGKAGVTSSRAGVTNDKAGVTNDKAGVTNGRAGVTNGRAGVTNDEAGVTNKSGKAGVTTISDSLSSQKQTFSISGLQVLVLTLFFLGNY